MAGARLPEFIKNAPILLPGLDWYMNCFWDLHTTRSSGFGPGRISVISVIEYGRLLGLSETEIDDLWYHVRQLDTVYMKWSDEKSKAS
jgi:hypothetical protein